FLGLELVRVRAADRGRLGIANDGRQVREGAKELARREAGKAVARIDDLERVADGRRIVTLELFKRGGIDHGGLSRLTFLPRIGSCERSYQCDLRLIRVSMSRPPSAGALLE